MEASDPKKQVAKLQCFLQWLQANGGELRGCAIRYCGQNKGFGVFSTAQPAGNNGDGVVMVVPLDLSITPMRVLQDSFFGPTCRALFEEGDVDDRFLVMLFLMVERLRPDSLWKPYLDMLPTTFGSSIWFTEDELVELKGTTLYRATAVQRRQLQLLFDNKVKDIAEELLRRSGVSESRTMVQFEDFLWANSIFWTRALNIPFPSSYVFPPSSETQGNNLLLQSNMHGSSEMDNDVKEQKEVDGAPKSASAETIWVEGLIPGIDFCNHGLTPAATWEVDPTGAISGSPATMYLVLADQKNFKAEQEISISYGNKGNEELLYLYGFIVDNNTDDYLMVHYPMEAFSKVPLSTRKAELLELQKAELRCLLPRNLLLHGFFSDLEDEEKTTSPQHSCYGWSGQRKVPSYLSKLVFPQEFLIALRTIAMQEHELSQVSSLLQEIAVSGEEREPSDTNVKAAIWEICGDFGAFQLLVDLLRVKMEELEEGTGTEASDDEILKNFHVTNLEDPERKAESSREASSIRNKWSSVIYRRGQKQLVRLFLREAEHALELSSTECK